MLTSCLCLLVKAEKHWIGGTLYGRVIHQFWPKGCLCLFHGKDKDNTKSDEGQRRTKITDRKELLVTSASLLVTSALLVVTRSF